MRIVLDLQGAQGVNAHRGIGRYSIGLACAIARQRGTHEVIVALNGGFADSIDRLRTTFEGLLPAGAIRVWDVPPSAPGSTDSRVAPATAECLYEAFLAGLQADVVHVSSLFEGFDDAAITSIGSLPHPVPVAVTLYDLIPLIRSTDYLQSSAMNRWYHGKIAHLRRADLLLAISESTRREVLEHLDWPPERVISISADADAHFQPPAPDDAASLAVPARYGLYRPYVLYTGGIDPRKNIEALIIGFAALPEALRHQHQLAIVCKIDEASRHRLKNCARLHCLGDDELVLTGYVPDEDMPSLYGHCRLFAFPSLHEGFGLPALEAMRCGAPVIGVNATSLPEVIGMPEALFEAGSEEHITRKLAEVLSDEDFLAKLARHALVQAGRFDWERSAREAIAAMERLHLEKTAAAPAPTPVRARLAFVSPLPPEQSGIADYSAQLLPELARFYDIDVVIAQESIADSWIGTSCGVLTVEQFEATAGQYDRVLYHFGNSRFHMHMPRLLERFPGVVVLHDFFLGDLQAAREFASPETTAWWMSLYASHGYTAMRDRLQVARPQEITYRYPANFEVLRNADGLIVHSGQAIRLAADWYGEGQPFDWACIPLMRCPSADASADARAVARQKLGLRENDFLICSFGLLGPTKQNHRLYEAFAASALAASTECQLIFVGENHAGEYGVEFAARLAEQAERISITGWTDAETFAAYLDAADVAVQLRAISRGETSAAVLDCMNHGLPTIVNANGSMADLPADAVLMLPDHFENAELSAALESLWRDPARRGAMAQRAREVIREHHRPPVCAAQYRDAIERFHQRSTRRAQSTLVRALSTTDPMLLSPPAEQRRKLVAQSIADNLPRAWPARQLFIDISELIQRDAGTGIQRVVKQLLFELLAEPPEGFRIEPVYAQWGLPGYRYARKFMMRFLGCGEGLMKDDLIQPHPGDYFLGLDLQTKIVVDQTPFFERWRRRGMRVGFVVYDLLPITLPHCFPEEGEQNHEQWLQLVTRMDQALCISDAVKGELREWMDRSLDSGGRTHRPPFDAQTFHLGADIPVDATDAVPAEAAAVLAVLELRPSFVMVGTVEPRKGHAETLAAFDALWAAGQDVNLVIVGKLGWMVDRLAAALESHAELGRRLFWLRGIGDGYLGAVYTTCHCLIAASLDEGFGLPLIEAAQKGKSIIARDIPVFREVAGEHAFYFGGSSTPPMAKALTQWLALHARGEEPHSRGMPWLTWKQSAEQLKSHMRLD